MIARSGPRSWLGAAVLLAGLAAAGCSSSSATADPPGSGDPGTAETETVTVDRRDVTNSLRVTALVGFGPIRTFPTRAGGIVTWAPEQGTVLSPGDVAVMIDNRPVILATGDMPAYRELRLVPFTQLDRAGNPVGLQRGPDVDQLHDFLIDQGFDDDGELRSEEIFGTSTDRAARAWQASIGHDSDGIVNDRHLVFVPGPIRVESDLLIGEPFDGFSYTGTDVLLTIDAATTARRYFAVGSSVEVRAGDLVTDGTVTKSTRTLDPASGSARQTVLVAVDGVSPDELGDTVDVHGSVVEASDALAVPVRALLALAEGGWALDVVTDDGSAELVGVELVRVVGTTAVIDGLEEGTEVVVPR